MGYSLSLENISLANYKELLRAKYLTPGRQILHEDMDVHFEALTNAGMDNLAELERAILTSKKLKAFAIECGLSVEYLTILRREIGSLVPKAVALEALLPDDLEERTKLAEAGIKTSEDYYTFYCSAGNASQVAQRLGIGEMRVDYLFSLCDLVRINGVGPQAARALYEADYHLAADVAQASAEEMLARVSTANDAGQYYKAKLGLKDMQFCIDHARLLHSQDDELCD